MLKLTLTVFLILLCNSTFGQSFSKLIDEDFSDWTESDLIYSDDINDQNLGAIDLGKIWMSSDSSYLYFSLEVGAEINLQELNDITMYIDTDYKSSTGLSVNNIGADLQYTFGRRTGKFYSSSGTTNIIHKEFGLISAPTVTSKRFEVGVKLNSVISGQKVFNSDSIRFLIKDLYGGDSAPNTGSAAYKLSPKYNFTANNYKIKKQEDHLRIVTYNVLRDNLFVSSLSNTWGSILKTIDADIFAFQEIYNHSSLETAQFIESKIPSSAGETWYHARAGSDIITVSRFPIKQSYNIDGNGAFLIDTHEKYNTDILLVSAHPPCCANNDSRQKEIDAIMAFIRDAKTEGGIITVPRGTPIVIVGDMNLVGFEQQRTTIITGDIVNENLYGADFKPDWNDSNLVDSKSLATDFPFSMTWYDERSAYSPGRLDYIFYSGSVMNLKNSFVFFTKVMKPDTLARYGLKKNDVVLASDHVPVVADFTLNKILSISQNTTEPIVSDFILYQNYPNPFNPSTVIKFQVPSSKFVKLQVFDLLGKEIQTFVSEQKPAGNYEVVFDGSGLASGFYIYQLQSGGAILSRKMLLIK
ncbi:MAG: endonuclease/exonuclease/phosphatase family protein [Bacteroidota bacterium]